MEVFKEQLRVFYAEHNPLKLRSLDALAKAYFHNQRELGNIMAGKYGANLDTSTYEVTVHLLSGDSFAISIPNGLCTISSLKEKIAKRQGWWVHLQQIFLRRDVSANEELILAQQPLRDEETIKENCSVLLLQTSKPAWAWSLSYEYIKVGSRKKSRVNRIFKLSGHNGCIATKVERGLKRDPWANCLTCSPAMPMNSGIHSISLRKFSRYSCALGVVRQGASPFKCHALDYDSDAGWFMFTATGGLCGNGKRNQDRAGRVGEEDVLTMEVDLSGTTQNNNNNNKNSNSTHEYVTKSA